MAVGMAPGLSVTYRQEKAEPTHPDPLVLTVVGTHQDPLVLTVAGLGKGHSRTNQPKPVPDQNPERVHASSVTDKGILSWIALARIGISGTEQ